MFVYNTNDAILKLRYSNADPMIPFTIHGGKLPITELSSLLLPDKMHEKKIALDSKVFFICL